MAESSARLLIVDDDPALCGALRTVLASKLDTIEAADGLDGLRAFHRARPDVVVVDVDVPRLGGYELLQRIRDVGDTPVLMLARVTDSRTIVRALRAGADDFLAKPLDIEELAARIEAILRRTQRGRARQDAHIELDQGRLMLDVGRAEVRVRGERIELSATEFRLLFFLARHPDRLISPSEILTNVWGAEYVSASGYVKSYVRLLRRKIEEDPHEPRYLISRRGLGYTLVSSPGASDI